MSGPSGSGKGTLVKQVLGELDNIVLSISATTRKPRVGEVEGKDYYFIESANKFYEKIRNNEFLEWARVHGCYYGTLEKEIEDKNKAGKDVILEIDSQGASQVRKKKDDTVTIFIKPPSVDTLKDRLEKRGTEKTQDIKVRLNEAKNEIKKSPEYNYVIINDDLKKASYELFEVIRRERKK